MTRYRFWYARKGVQVFTECGTEHATSMDAACAKRMKNASPEKGDRYFVNEDNPKDSSYNRLGRFYEIQERGLAFVEVPS